MPEKSGGKVTNQHKMICPVNCRETDQIIELQSGGSFEVLTEEMKLITGNNDLKVLLVISKSGCRQILQNIIFKYGVFHAGQVSLFFEGTSDLPVTEKFCSLLILR